MIGYIKGKVADKQEEYVIVDNQGIGWQIYVPSSLLDSELRVGEEVKLHTWLHVREDVMQLFGFYTRDDLDVFRLLLNISGIGPKAAIKIMSNIFFTIFILSPQKNPSTL